MSHHSTPHLRGDINRNFDANSNVTDSSATTPKQLLNAYVYDFLIKSKLPQTAKIFVNEAEIPAVDDHASQVNGGGNSGNSSNHGESNIPGDNNKHQLISPQSPSVLQFHKDNNLPILKVSMDSPQGFLFEWWQVFWDVFQAKNNHKYSSPVATQYYQLQLMKQRQQLDLSSINTMNMMHNHQGGGNQNHPFSHPMQGNNGTGTINTNPMQAQQQRLMMQYMMKQQQQQQQQQQQPQSQPQSQPPQLQNGPPPQPSGGPVGPNGQNLPNGINGPNGPNGPMMNSQQMFMMQNHPQNGIQQHAQNQMNNLRQQGVAQKSNDHGSPSNPNLGHPGPNGHRLSNPQPPGASIQNQPLNHAHPGGPQQLSMNGQIPYAQPPSTTSQAPTPYNQSINDGPVMRMNNQNNNNQSNVTNPKDPSSNVNASHQPQMPPNTNRNTTALQDYQMQLMLLEKQNKKRLDIARNSGTNDPNLINSLNNNMLPPNQQLQQALNNGMTGNPTVNNNLPMNNLSNPMMNQMNNMPMPPNSNQPTPIMNTTTNNGPVNANNGPSSAGPSPTMINKPSPGGSQGKKKKEATGKRGRKPSNATNTTNPNNSNNAGTPSNSVTTPSHLKKEISTPLTPTLETPNENGVGKRKRKSNESPKKVTKAKKESIKEEEEEGAEESKGKGEGEEKLDQSTNSNPIPSTTNNSNNSNGDVLNMAPSVITSNFQDLGGNDQIFSMDVIESNSNDQIFNQNGLEDIEFDFNLFLDNGNDDINGFNWGVDAIEGDN